MASLTSPPDRRQSCLVEELERDTHRIGVGTGRIWSRVNLRNGPLMARGRTCCKSVWPRRTSHDESFASGQHSQLDVSDQSLCAHLQVMQPVLVRAFDLGFP